MIQVGDRVRIKDDQPSTQYLFPTVGTVEGLDDTRGVAVLFDPIQEPSQGRLFASSVWISPPDVLEVVERD